MSGFLIPEKKKEKIRFGSVSLDYPLAVSHNTVALSFASVGVLTRDTPTVSRTEIFRGHEFIKVLQTALNASKEKRSGLAHTKSL